MTAVDAKTKLKRNETFGNPCKKYGDVRLLSKFVIPKSFFMAIFSLTCPGTQSKVSTQLRG